MDASLTRQFLRLKRSGVRPHTWLANHMQLMGLLVPSKDLQKVLSADGEWQGVADSIMNLMESSNVGRTVFSFCSQLVNASHYKAMLDSMLLELKASGFKECEMEKFKVKAQKAADSFKALLAIQTSTLNHPMLEARMCLSFACPLGVQILKTRCGGHISVVRALRIELMMLGAWVWVSSQCHSLRPCPPLARGWW